MVSNEIRIHPAMSIALTDILKNPAIWRIGQVPISTKAALASGSAELDAVLPGNGWECGALTEILANDQGIGELSILMPALRDTTRGGRAVVLVAPPYMPLPSAWEAQGVLLSRVVIIHAERQAALWAIEQTARSGAVGMVVAWESHHRRDWNYPALRRLHVAAEQGSTALMLYRRASALADASPAPTRLVLSAKAGELQVRVAKRRGALMAETLQLNVYPAHWRARTVNAAFHALKKQSEKVLVPAHIHPPLRRLSASR